MKRLQALFIALLLVLSMASFPRAASDDPVIRVLLSAGTPSALTVTLSGNYTINGKKVTGGTITATNASGKVAVTHSAAGALVTGDSVRLIREAGASDTTNFKLTLSSGTTRTYLGDLVLLPSGGGLQAVNHVPMREYLYGAVRGEVSEGSHVELLKTQVIISRCFALVEAAARTRQTYDVTDTTSTQLYVGYPASIPRIKAAVDELYLHTLRLGSTTVKTHYGTANGGATLTPKTRWGGTTAYENAYQLRYDPFDLRGNANNVTLLVDGAAPANMNSTLLEYLLALATANISGTATRIVSVSAMQGVDSAGTAVGLPTTSPLVEQAGMKVTMEVARSAGANVTTTVTANFAALIGRGLKATGNIRFVTQVGVGRWHVVFGLSSGPRAGLSHRGAGQMAALGYTYVDILKFYYPGATLFDANGWAVSPIRDTSLEGVLAFLGLGGGAIPTPTPTPAPVITAYGVINAVDVNFRTGPSTSYASMAKLAKGTELGIYEAQKIGSWNYVMLLSTGQVGYVSDPYVTRTADATPTPSPTPRPPATPNPNIVPKMVGDVDGNGAVAAADASLILRYLVRLEAFNEAQLLAADADGDGLVTAADASKILRWLVRLEAKLGA